MDNRISFTSNINFVSERNLRRIVFNNRSEYIPFEQPYYTCQFIKKSKNFFTNQIKTCTAGGLTDGKNNAVGFHILDSIKNFENIENIQKQIFDMLASNPISGILIGSKDLPNRHFSIPIFENMTEFMKKSVPDLSIFKQHNLSNGESHIHYDVKTDTWNICTKLFNKEKECYYSASSVEDIKKAYESIEIAPNDKLLINGKEVCM